MTLHIPSEYEPRLRAAAIAAGYNDVQQYVIDRLLGDQRTLPQAAVRRGGQWKGQVVIADDFDELPDDMREAFGMKGGDEPSS
ncbi:hypothetical protein [Aeoliella sp. SH292]|uniref:hypothetical protein n=1 Tax=Aeoliella sp. SH292 TaxID=3454464 RepID=UPI003F94571B